MAGWHWNVRWTLVFVCELSLDSQMANPIQTSFFRFSQSFVNFINKFEIIKNIYCKTTMGGKKSKASDKSMELENQMMLRSFETIQQVDARTRSKSVSA